MDAISDLGIGNIMESPLQEIWTGQRMGQIRASFGDGTLNTTCSGCDMYRGWEFYRLAEGRKRAKLNRLRHQGHLVRRADRPRGPFPGG